VTAGFLLQAAALGNGQLSVVEPILVLELPFTLLLATRVFHARLHRREWGAAIAMSAGLAALLYALSPRAGKPAGVRWYQWVIGGPGSSSGGTSGGASTGNSAGLEYTFLLFLGTLLIAGLLALAGLRTYPRDVATAAASADAIGQAAANGGEEDRPAA
jgi:hypothetical protein